MTWPSGLTHLHKVLQQFRSFRGEEALRVELDAVERPGAMADPHDFVFVGPGRDDEIGVLEGFPPDDQAVIAGRLEGIGKTPENPLAIVMDRRSLTMHDPIIANDFAAKYVAATLVPEANAQDRRF